MICKKILRLLIHIHSIMTDSSYIDISYAIRAGGGFYMEQFFGEIPYIGSIGTDLTQIYDLTNTLQIDYDVRIFNEKIGIFKDSSNNTIIDSTNSLIRDGFSGDNISISADDLLNHISDTQITSLGKYSTLYTDFIRKTNTYFGYADGFARIFDTSGTQDVLTTPFSTQDIVNILKQTVIDGSNNTVYKLSGVINIYQLTNLLSYMALNDPFSNRSGKTQFDGFFAGDRIFAQSLTQPRSGQLFPQCVPDLAEETIRALGQQYLDQTRRHRGKAAFFTDKMPNNFAYVGFIKTLLPNAKIIDARRHPMDSCFGCFKQHFAKGQTFTYDLFELGEFYLEYHRLMTHWDTVLPGQVLSVQYEQVVDDLETQVRRILDFCELPFEAGCVNFHENKRAVRTASSEQVRQPIYTGSVQTWKRYEAHLEGLRECLTPVLPDPQGLLP